MEKLVLKVVSDGTVPGTLIVDQYGNSVDDIKEIKICFDADTGVPIINLEFHGLDIEWISRTRKVTPEVITAESFSWAKEEESQPGLSDQTVSLGWEDTGPYHIHQANVIDLLKQNTDAMAKETDPVRIKALKENYDFLMSMLRDLPQFHH